MRKWKPYGADSWAFHEFVVDSKYNTNPAKATALKYQSDLWQRFAEYNYLFPDNDLASLTTVVFDTDPKNNKRIKEHFHDLYKYDSNPFQFLKNELTTTSTGVEITTCPLCRLDLISSLDHIVPRQAFPEFSTHPYNLIPSCDVCNGKKNSIWIDNGHYKYLNPYIDDVESKTYLRVKIEWVEDRGIPVFEVFRGSGISDDLFEKIEAHHEALNLCTRYQERCSEVLGSIASTIRESSDGQNMYAVRKSLIHRGEEILSSEGESDWEGLLYKECGYNLRFAKYLQSYYVYKSNP